MSQLKQMSQQSGPGNKYDSEKTVQLQAQQNFNRAINDEITDHEEQLDCNLGTTPSKNKL